MTRRTLRTVLAPAVAAVLLSCGDAPTTPVPAPAALTAPGGGAASLVATGGVRFSELHYDNAGTDTGEAIEVIGPGGTDLEAWQVVLYNGSNGTVYDTRTLAGVLGDACDGEGVVALAYGTNGIQNGAPDGMALVDPDGTLVEFLSWEGAFTPGEGPAAGVASTDIGVAESSSTPEGSSLRRDPASGAWLPEAPESFGACNPPGDGGGGGGGGGSDDGPRVNELHYDNAGSDEGEAVEVAGPAGTDLTGWSIALYNGSNGAVYATLDLAGTLEPTAGSTCTGQGFLSVDHAGIQNGSPDGLALVDAEGAVVEFLSYEGTLTASDGPAVGTTSTDIGVAEDGDTPVGSSLARDASGAWQPPAPSTFGACNDGSGGGGGGGGGTGSGEPVFLSEIRADQPGGDSDEYFELGGAPGVSLDGVTYLVIGDGAGGDGVVEMALPLDGGALDASGAYVVAEGSFSLGTPDRVASLNFENGGNVTHLLVRGFTGANGQDLDTDDDGTLDALPWASIADCVSLVEYLGAGPVYCDMRLGADLSFTPGHAVRTDGGWISAIFTPGIDDTPRVLLFDPATATAGVLAPWGVGAPGEVTGVSVSASFVEIPAGFDRALFARAVDDFRDPVDVPLTFATSDPAVMTVDGFGNLSAEGVGTATLTVAAGAAASADVTVEVVPDVPSGVAFQDHTSFGVPVDGSPFDDLLVHRDEYVLSYNPLRAGANWVAWNLDADHFGGADRCECYTPDPALPAGAPAVVNFDFTGSGYSRGHMAMSFDRTATLPDNASTYYTTNILPQAAANNTGPWGDFEAYVNDRAMAGEEVYVVAGGEWGDVPTTLKGEGKVAVPDWTWKVAVFVDREEDAGDVAGPADVEVIAIRTPNRIEPGVDGTVAGISGDWEDYRVEVDALEAATGYDLLSALPDAFEEALESGLLPLADAFRARVAAGEVAQGARTSLANTLDHVGDRLRDGKRKQAASMLETFLTQLDAFEGNGKVTAPAAAELRAAALHVLGVLALG